tara:strand:+ start:218 stop:793 length:576 start_codon:yes stop_codon:yes gene_type:complete
MIIIDKTIISSDIYEEKFICDLDKCKGACCVEGDLGAPLELQELSLIESAVKKAKKYLSKESKEILEKDGAYILDDEGDFSTTTLNGKECSFAFHDNDKTLKCSIEQAWLDGKSNFRKPISCHLYPIRISRLQEYETLNYDRWSICECARILGKKKGTAIYKFLKKPLIRKYGKVWYQKLCDEIELLKSET